MNLKRVQVALKMVILEFTRRRLILVLLIVVPVLLFFSVYYALPETEISIDVVERGVTFKRIAGQRDIVGTFIVLFSVSFLGAFFGFYLMLSARKVDHRLILVGYRPGELVMARSLVLGVLCLGLSLYVTLMLLPFSRPKHLFGFFGGVFLCALIYSYYGELIGAWIGRELEGSYLIVLLPFLDTGYLQIPGFSEVLNEAWLKFMPGYFPARFVVDAAFTSILDVRHEFVGALVYALGMGFLTTYGFWRATRIYAGTPKENKRMKTRRRIVVAAATLVLALAISYVALPYINLEDTVKAEGYVTAPGASIISLASGKVQHLMVEAGDQVEAGQRLGDVEDWLTGKRYVIRAPMAGTVTRVHVRIGEDVLAGDALVDVHDLRRLEVRLEVEETFIAQVAVNQRVTVAVSGLSHTLQGQVVTVGLAPIPEEAPLLTRERKIKKYPVTVALNANSPDLRLGMSVSGTIHTK